MMEIVFVGVFLLFLLWLVLWHAQYTGFWEDEKETSGCSMEEFKKSAEKYDRIVIGDIEEDLFEGAWWREEDNE